MSSSSTGTTTTSTAKTGTSTTTTTPPVVLTKKPYDDTGTDFKSVFLNASSIAFFFLPFVIYIISKLPRKFYEAPMNINYYYGSALGLTGLLYAIAFIIPPIGWKRPHPYSDDPTNVPSLLRKNQ